MNDTAARIMKKAEYLGQLTAEMNHSKTIPFIDFVDNNLLPMVLVNSEYMVLHANQAMKNLTGNYVGKPCASYWHNDKEHEAVISDLKKNGFIRGKKVTLKDTNGIPRTMKLYSSIHRDSNGKWINTRCLFVPVD
jgi:hypothetical protein